jgi:hypothetical protein
MANTHVLEQTAPGRFRVVYHVAIPATNNAAGVAWRAIMAQQVAAQVAQVGGRASVLPDGDGTGGTISAAEKAQVVSGALYEAVREEKGQGAATLAAQFALRSAEILAGLQARYAQYGRNI